MILIKRSTNVVVGVAAGVDGEDGEEEEDERPGAAVEEGGDGWEEAALVHHLHQPNRRKVEARETQRGSHRRVLGMDGRERFWLDYLLNIAGARLFILDIFWLSSPLPWPV